MKAVMKWSALVCVVAAAVTLHAQTTKVDLSKEVVGKPPAKFQAIGRHVDRGAGWPGQGIKIDAPRGRRHRRPPPRAHRKPRKLYGTNNEELMDNAKAFANFPVAVLQGVDNFSNGTISVKFKTVSGDLDRASGILFNVKPNGDWLRCATTTRRTTWRCGNSTTASAAT